MKGKPAAETLRELAPDLTPEHVDDFLTRLPDRYFEHFGPEDILQDVGFLASVTADSPFKINAEALGDGSSTCAVYAFDLPGIFSLITGLLSATGFNIESGSIFTYRKARERSTAGGARKKGRGNIGYTAEKPRLIIDRFAGKIRSDYSFEKWRTDFTEHMERLFALIPGWTGEPITGARTFVYEAVSRALADLRIETRKVLFPVEIGISGESATSTHLTVVTEDTPFFLFSVSNALALNGFSIESVGIRTHGNRVVDDIEISNAKGGALLEAEQINQAKMSILLTKQFTYFLGTAPDPYAALVRFESIANDLLKSGASWEPLLSNPGFLRDLSRLLGASDFLWEDFIRLQYENILPLLAPETRNTYLSHDSSQLESIVTEELASAKTLDEKRAVLNDFKNREVYLIDLDHIIRPNADLLFLSGKLSKLAEVVVLKAVDIAKESLATRYNKPKTFAGLDARYAILGLGKLGGVALGYASDIELLFVYGDNGTTNGPEGISNAEYFERLFKTAMNLIEAKQEGIFHIDLRLRPYGNAGPTACSLESFCQYYGPGGQAHSYEKLALIRMRAIGGDPELGARIERLRDEMVYRRDSVDLKDLRQLRERQLEEKVKSSGGRRGRHPGASTGDGEQRLNVKFSPGGLVDLEYTVQIIQCRYGKDNPKLRTPRIHSALEELVRAGILSGNEAEQLVESYYFLRKLINGLRMLRGSAKDLFLPQVDSDEYVHLARRTGYTGGEGLSPAAQLHMDFQTRTAVIRRFIESHLGRDSIPGPPGGNVADLVLSDSIPHEVAARILAEGGLKNLDRALTNIVSLKGEDSDRLLFAGLAVLAWDVLRDTPDPDMALNNWERFSISVPSKEEHFRQLFAQPLQLEILLEIFAGSQFLADTVVKNPDFVGWVAQPRLINTLRKREDILGELQSLSEEAGNTADWMRSLRILRKREILRIGTRDICLAAPLTEVVMEISRLADAMIQGALERVWGESISSTLPLDESGFAVFAFGKLGGGELNYSSDIDLLALYDGDRYSASDEKPEVTLTRVMERLRSHLADHTEHGFAYRVDFRLRPYGRASLLAHSLTSILEYYEKSASLWELQALIKMRPVAGDLGFGEAALAALTTRLRRPIDATAVTGNIRKMRNSAASRRSSIGRGIDIKSGEGGIRDIEFLVQGLQLIHSFSSPEVLNPNTLDALAILTKKNIIDKESGQALRDDYIYLRRVEHLLQLLEDRQVHAIPTDPEALAALAKRIEGKAVSSEDFAAKLNVILTRVRGIYESLLPA